MTRHNIYCYCTIFIVIVTVLVIFNEDMRKMAQLLLYYFVACRMRMKETSLSG